MTYEEKILYDFIKKNFPDLPIEPGLGNKGIIVKVEKVKVFIFDEAINYFVGNLNDLKDILLSLKFVQNVPDIFISGTQIVLFLSNDISKVSIIESSNIENNIVELKSALLESAI